MNLLGEQVPRGTGFQPVLTTTGHGLEARATLIPTPPTQCTHH